MADGTLDNLFRDKVRQRNGLVRDVLNRIAIQDEITLKQLAESFKEALPVLEVSDISWSRYAHTFSGWLTSFGLIRPGQIVGERGRRVGGTRSATNKSEVFLPSIYSAEITQTIAKFRDANTVPKSSLGYEQWYDCERIGLIQIDRMGENFELTGLGKTFKNNELARGRIIREFLHSLPYISDYLNLVETSRKRHIDVLKSVLVGMTFTEETWIWRSKVIANWLKYANLITRKSGLIHRSQQNSLFE